MRRIKMALTGIYRVQALRRAGTAADWTAENTILANGEIGVETDSGKSKIGDGATAWASLAYVATAPTCGSGVTSVAGRSGAVVLTIADVTGAAPLASPTFTGTVTVPTLTLGNSTTGAASTAFVAAAIAAIPATPAATTSTVGVVKMAALQSQGSGWTDASAQGSFNALLTKLINAGLMSAT